MVTTADAAKLGWLALVSENLFLEGKTKPRDVAPIEGLGYTPVAVLIARDVDPLALRQTSDAALALLGLGDTSYYGFLARATIDPNRFVICVRGTMDPAEWAIDARFPTIAHPDGGGLEVESGFWSIYETMQMVDLDGVSNPVRAATGLAEKIDAAAVTVVGHSLGSALATYLTYDLVKSAKGPVSACLFASPRTGNAAWVVAFDKAVKEYALYNYILDVVPKVPFDALPLIQYSTLPRETVLDPLTVEANIAFDIPSHHHVICYSAMLNYQATVAWPGVVGDGTWASVIGPVPVSGFSLNHDLAVGVAIAVEKLEGFGREAVRLISVTAQAKGAHV